MSGDTKRDPAIEALLRRSLKAPGGASGADACLDAETLAAWAEGGLDQDAAMMAEAHMAACDRCQATLKAMSIVSMPPATESAPARSWWKIAWLVPVTAGAVAIALYVATPDQQSVVTSQPPAPQETQNPAPAATREQQPQAFSAPQAAAEAATPAPPAPELKRERDAVSPPAAAPPATDARADAGAGARGRLEANREVESAFKAAPPSDADRTAGLAAAAPQARRVLGESRAVASAREVVLGEGMIRWRLPAASAGAIERSIDGGKTWERIPFPEIIELVTIQATDGQTATVTTADGRVFRTTDGGKTWLRP